MRLGFRVCTSNLAHLHSLESQDCLILIHLSMTHISKTVLVRNCVHTMYKQWDSKYMVDIDTPSYITKEMHQNGVYETPHLWLLGSCYMYLAYILLLMNSMYKYCTSYSIRYKCTYVIHHKSNVPKQYL